MKLHSQAALTLKQRQKVKRLHEEGVSIRKLAQRFGVNPTTIQRWTKRESPLDKSSAPVRPCRGALLCLKDHTPVILATGQRFSCNMISAITNQGHLNFMVFKERFTAQVFLEFLRRLLSQSDRRIYLIIDRHPVHRALKVKNWVKENEERLWLVFLPSYSPEINPDELLNQDIKSNALGRQRLFNQTELMSKVRSYLWSRQRKPDVVANYFQGKHVHYAA